VGPGALDLVWGDVALSMMWVAAWVGWWVCRVCVEEGLFGMIVAWDACGRSYVAWDNGGGQRSTEKSAAADCGVAVMRR